MSAISELIDVQFVDNTNYANTSSNDVIGCVFDHCWGPVGQMVTYGQKEFFGRYPEGLPFGWSPNNSSNFYSYAQIKKVFGAAGSAGMVEAYRLRGNWGYLTFPVCYNQGVGVAIKEFEEYTDAYNEKQFPEVTDYDTDQLEDAELNISDVAKFQIALRYPGFFPYAGDFSAYKDFKIKVDLDTADSLNPVTISLYGIIDYRADLASTDRVVLLERFYGSFDSTAMVDSQSFYISDIVNTQSQFIRMNIVDSSFRGCDVNDTYKSATVYLNSVEDTSVIGSGSDVPDVLPRIPLLTYDDIYGSDKPSVFTDTTLSEYFGFIEDSEMSLGTIYIAPIPFSCNINNGVATDDGTGVLDVYKSYSSAMNQRKDASFIWGYPTPTVLTAEFNEENVKAVGNMSFVNSQSMFTTFFGGVEQYSVYGMLIYLDCTAGVAGRTIAVAKDTKVNQLASSRLYGAYPGTLYKTLNFTSVQRLHKDENINSVYSTPNGNYIFGIKDNYPRKNSYFSKWNVARVVNRLLKLTYPIILDAIHTETVSDDTTRLRFLSAITDVLNSLIPANIKEESTVRMETDDVKTRGGEEIILYYDIWFKKLAEHCTITIAATDSSVNVSIQ